MKIRAATILLAVLCSVSTYADGRAAVSLTELHNDQQETVSMERWYGEPLLVVFWRSDCLPCLQEMKLLPDIAKNNSALAIALISLQDAERTRARLPALPENVHVLVAAGDGRKVLANFGNERALALPYSVMLDKKGDVCRKYYGILSPDTVKEWQGQC